MLYRTHTPGSLNDRDPAFKNTDARVVRWIAQTAINVELFTIPLYMTALYSLTGMHPITGQGNDFYAGRQWPGAKPSFRPKAVDRSQPGWANPQAFNIIFSVFIQEMLHLQMAANLATAIGVSPSFTSTVLQTKNHGWSCYSPTSHTIPGCVDLRDTDRYTDVIVNTGPVDRNTLRLFLAIEQPQHDAEADIVRNKERYFPKVPFDGGNPGFNPATSGMMFGSIGYMYQCYRDYLLIRYADGTRLWDYVFTATGQQNDLFNNFSFPGHPMREFPGFETTLALTDKEIALDQALTMMNAITDQGEGATLKGRLHWFNDMHREGEVKRRYQPSKTALKADYPGFSDTGQQIPSADAVARADNDREDHYHRFQEVMEMLEIGGIQTWDQSPKPGKWQAADLITDQALYAQSMDKYKLPSAEDIATAMNTLHGAADTHTQLSQTVLGAIKGVTTVLDSYWAGTTASFPFPSMVGSGDRMSACWAITGQGPDLSIGIAGPNYNILNHACQGLSLTGADAATATNACAEVAIFHTCRGSNLCKGMSGCGFVQSASGGGGGNSCSSGGGCGAVKMKVQGGLCGGPKPPPTPTPTTLYTAPSDNTCQGYGGCAVPISAAQVYPQSGDMVVYQFLNADGSQAQTPTKLGTISFSEGEKVEDVAFKAFSMVVENLGKPIPPQPAPSALRLAFPPST